MLDLTEDDDAVVLSVHAQPRAMKNALAGIHNGRLKVAVTQAPEKGKANEAILKLLAKSLGLKRSQLELLSGAASTKKAVRVTGIDIAELRSRIETVLDG